MNTYSQLLNLISGLSSPSKLPCHGYSISSSHCNTGSTLRGIEGSVCSKCYAHKGNYVWSNVTSCHERRYNSMMNDPNWVNNMSSVINHLNEGYFRWFDSGDLQSVENLKNIVEVCKNTPTTKHWLPTKEYGIVKKYIDNGGVIPDNLVIRLSGYMIDGPAPTELAKQLNVVTSTVTKTGVFNCLASLHDNKCCNCRKCWNKNVKNVAYKYH